jgi:hypothetical protein
METQPPVGAAIALTLPGRPAVHADPSLERDGQIANAALRPEAAGGREPSGEVLVRLFRDAAEYDHVAE